MSPSRAVRRRSGSPRLIGGYVSTAYNDVILYAALFAVIVFRPRVLRLPATHRRGSIVTIHPAQVALNAKVVADLVASIADYQ